MNSSQARSSSTPNLSRNPNSQARSSSTPNLRPAQARYTARHARHADNKFSTPRQERARHRHAQAARQTGHATQHAKHRPLISNSARRAKQGHGTGSLKRHARPCTPHSTPHTARCNEPACHAFTGHKTGTLKQHATPKANTSTPRRPSPTR